MTNCEMPYFKPETFKCAVLDANGFEIPITQAMVEQACQQLAGRKENHYPFTSKPTALR
jgi:hypothetical protein